METFLILNGYEIAAHVDEQERTVLDVCVGPPFASGAHGMVAEQVRGARRRRNVAAPRCPSCGRRFGVSSASQPGAGVLALSAAVGRCVHGVHF